MDDGTRLDEGDGRLDLGGQVPVGAGAFDAVVLMTGCDAHVRGFEVVVPGDCTASPKDADARQALDLLRRAARAEIADGECIDWRAG